jgi:hypothetical protein
VRVHLCACVCMCAFVDVCECGWMSSSVCLSTCSLNYPACKAQPYCFSACLVSTTFSILSHEGHNFREKVAEHKTCIFTFSTTFTWNISHYRKNSARYSHKHINVSVWITSYSCRILINIEFPQIFEKTEISSCSIRMDGQTWRS